MPAYNAENYIEESILSVQQQTFQNWELIVVDDGSTDKTSCIVKQMQENDSRIFYYYQKNKRLGAARNAGFRLAKGEYIAFLDSDDLWMPEKLHSQIIAIKEKNVDLVFTDGYEFQEKTKQLIPYKTITGFYSSEDMYKILYSENVIAVLSVLMKSEWVKKVGFQGECLEIFGCEDWDYWLRMSRNGASFYGMSEKLFKYRVHDGGMSKKDTVMKLAMFTALYNNIDYSKLSNYYIFERLESIMKINSPSLLLIDKRNFAIEEIEKILKLKFKFKFWFGLLILRLNMKHLNKIVFYLFNPSSILTILTKVKEA